MKWISQAEKMREADRYAMEELHIPGILLMEAAARSVVERLKQRLQKDQRVLVLCGTGNNGGDGFAIARMLKTSGISVKVFFGGDPALLTGDAKTNYELLAAYQISVLTQQPASELIKLAEQSDWIVDAVFGTGLDREIQGVWVEVISYINQLHRSGKIKVIAVDVPSGVHADSGAVLGCAVEADETVTFCNIKQGQLLFPGRDYVGRLTVADIGMPEAVPGLRNTGSFMLEKEDVHTLLPGRQSRSHKGLYGHLLVVAGSKSMTGAAVLSSRAAYKMGTGLVNVAIPRAAVSVLQMSVPEAITTPYEEEGIQVVSKQLLRSSAVLIGPGLSQEPYAGRLLQEILSKIPKEQPLVLDADALNWLAGEEELAELVRGRGGNTILTPHMGEASRLLHQEVQEIMEHPLEAVHLLQETYQSIAVLKDAVTLVCGMDGTVFYNSTGNNGMSTAGSGDVLAGMISGLCAQHVPVFEAAYSGVYLHGAAGDLAKVEHGVYGMTASDIASHIDLEKMIANIQ